MIGSSSPISPIKKLAGLFLIGLLFLTQMAGAAPQTTEQKVYFPIMAKPYAADFELPTEVLPAPQIFAQANPNFNQIATDLQQEGLKLTYNKIGFHMGPAGNAVGLTAWMQSLDTAGVPFFLKSVDDAGAIYEAQEMMKASGVPHTLVYRRSGLGYDLPDYNVSPEEAAVGHWARHLAVFPPELDKELVWLETINEVDKNRSEWLARFALKTAQLAIRDGYKWAAFGWSAGEPENSDWSGPEMLEFLRYAADRPEQIAIALHEYSYTRDDIGRLYPYLLGRFQQLFHICDTHGIERPTILITEWGWEYQNIPDKESAMADIRWAARLYAAYPEVKGAAVWYLGGNFGDVHNQTQRLITPLKEYSLTHYFGITPGKGKIDQSVLAPAVADRNRLLFESDPFRAQVHAITIANQR